MPTEAEIFRLADELVDWWFRVRPYPRLTERYNAAKEASLGAQLTSEELTDRVRVELQNAFAAGALWQYHRGDEALPSDRREGSGDGPPATDDPAPLGSAS